ncbi:MAG TPA: ATP-binding protein, partial [Acidimicrobiales bacterium]|nr:ATP-binding protein [Acidimicrobiales bacterium]
DDGPGIAPDDLAHVFDRHFKASSHRSSAADSGSGLGLSIASESAQLLGGRIDVVSIVDVGTTFTLWLPTAPA